MTLRGTRSTPTRGSATPISALRKRWYFLALALGAFGARCHVGLVSAGRPIALLRILGRLLELVPANPPPLPLTLGSGRALRLRVRWRWPGTGARHATTATRCWTRSPHRSPPATRQPPLRVHRHVRASTHPQARAHARVECAHRQTHARACARFCHAHAYAYKQTPTQPHAHTHLRTHAHSHPSTHARACTNGSRGHAAYCLPRHRYVYTSNVDGHFRRQRQSRAQSVRGAVRPPSRQRLYAVVPQP